MSHIVIVTIRPTLNSLHHAGYFGSLIGVSILTENRFSHRTIFVLHVKILMCLQNIADYCINQPDIERFSIDKE